MDLTAQAIADIAFITSNTNDFGVPVTFTAPTSPLTIRTVGAQTTKHHTDFDELGNVVNTKKASVSVSEIVLNAAGYPVRTSAGLVDFNGHLVSWKDSNGTTFQYTVDEWLPDEKVGNIVLILGEIIG
jgi:hypothetical protein